MKIKETLTKKDRSDLFINSSLVGLFTDMFEDSDPFYSLAYPLCLGYYTIQSSNKTVSPVYEQMFDFYREYHNNKSEDEIVATINAKIGNTIIRPKFIDKWKRVYNTLIIEQYNPIDDYSETETKTGNDTDTTTYNLVDGKTGKNTDIITHDVTSENNGKTGTSETVSNSRKIDNDVYAFNSDSPVGDSTRTDTETQTVIGEAEKNTTHNTQTKTGTESKAIGIDETRKKTGTETKTYGINETYSRSGRHTNGADLVEAELNLRNKQIFFDIIYKDIDSVATISIY